MVNANKLEIVTDAQEWDAQVIHHNGHLLQSFAWGELKSRFGWSAERVAWRENGEFEGAAQVLYRRLAPGLTVADAPYGPFACGGQPCKAFFGRLIKHVRTRGAFLLKVEPGWLKGDGQEQILAELHMTHTDETVQPSASIYIDLSADLETILARMKSKWRYNIRLAEKKGVTVRAGGTADFPAFYELMRLTGERDHFAIHGLDYYRTAFELLEPGDHVRLFIAEYQGKPLAMIFVTAFGYKAIYLYGASGNEERNRMPNHALHWAAIQWAKERGCEYYDLWGIPETALEESDDANLPSSLYQFKQGFGGQTVRYSGAWDYVYSGARQRAYKLARQIYKRGLS